MCLGNVEMFSLNAVADGWLEVGNIQTQGVIAAATILGTTFGEETANSVGQPERFDRISIHSPSYIGALCRVIYFVYLVVKLPPVSC